MNEESIRKVLEALSDGKTKVDISLTSEWYYYCHVEGYLHRTGLTDNPFCIRDSHTSMRFHPKEVTKILIQPTPSVGVVVLIYLHAPDMASMKKMGKVTNQTKILRG